MAMDTDRAVGRAGRREWIGLAVLALPTVLLALDLSVTYLAVPQLSGDLGAGPTQLLWIADIYGFMLAGFLIPMGTLGDRIGHRRLLLIGAAAFGAASLLAAFSQTPTMLIVARALLGIAGASLNPSTLALITSMFTDPGQRAQAFAIWVSCFMGGTALGPVVGGVLLHFFWWGSVFLLGAPVMLVLLLTGRAFLPESRKPDAGRIDLLSVAMGLAAILPVIYGIKELAANGPRLGYVAAIVAGPLVGVAFVRRQRSLPEPLLDLTLFARPRLRVAALSLMLNTVGMSGVALLLNQYLISVRDLSPLNAGLLLAPPSLAVIATLLLAPRLARRFQPRFLIAGGMAVTAVGCAILTQIGTATPLAVVEIGYLLGMLGVGPLVALATDLIVGQAEPAKAGAAGAIRETADVLGFALGAALLGSIANAVYRGTLHVPDGVPAVAGHDPQTIAEAGVAAARLPAGQGNQLLAAADTAFTNGFTVAAATAMAIAAGIIALVLTTLRPSPPGDAGEPSAGAAEAVADRA